MLRIATTAEDLTPNNYTMLNWYHELVHCDAHEPQRNFYSGMWKGNRLAYFVVSGFFG